MIYLAIAAFALGLLAWDIARRWLDAHRVNTLHEQQFEKQYTRVNDLQVQLIRLGGRLDDLSDRYGDIGTQLNLRVRELGDRLEMLAKEAAEPVDVSEFRAEHEKLKAAFENFWKQIGLQFVGKEELATELAKLKSGQAVLAATGTNNRFGRRTG